MKGQIRNGAEQLWATLQECGVEFAFGVPGSQNVLLYEALRRSPIRSVLTTHELAAGFMAGGYFRASGKTAAVVTIPGPGFAYALPALAEARHDSAALLHIVAQPATGPGKKFRFQAIDQLAVAAPLVKSVISIERPCDVAERVAAAYAEANSGEPGPVVVHWAPTALDAFDREPASRPAPPAGAPPDGSLLDRAAALLLSARRPLLMVGQGAAGAAEEVARLSQHLAAPVFTTASGRGVVPEDQPLALGFEFARGNVARLNEIVRSADCILAIGCKLSHGGTGGFALELPADRLIHVDASEDVLGANYAASLQIAGRAEDVVPRLLATLHGASSGPPAEWTDAEIETSKATLRNPGSHASSEPVVHGIDPPTAARFFDLLRHSLPRDAILVADSGLHQGLARRHFDVLAPRGLLVPSDFQSMGFGLPAAIGAKLAAPRRTVAAVIGDGAFAMSAMELLTAVRERLALTVIVFNDGRLNQIRLQQREHTGHSESVDLLNPDFEAFAAAVGARYARVDGNAKSILREAAAGTGVTLIEVRLDDSRGMRSTRVRGLARASVRRAIGPRAIRFAKRVLRRGGPH